MAEKKIQPRLLTKSIGAARMAMTSQAEAFVVTLDTDSASGWQLITGAGNLKYAVWTGYIDLQGMTVAQDLSFSAQSVAFQEGQMWAGQGDAMISYDMVTDVPVNWTLALRLTSDGAQVSFPGMIDSTVNPENVVYGNMRMFLANGQVAGGILPAQASIWGTNRATASDRLYVHRIVLIQNISVTSATQYAIPPCIVAIPGLFFEEKDLAHMERLRRSYILQQ